MKKKPGGVRGRRCVSQKHQTSLFLRSIITTEEAKQPLSLCQVSPFTSSRSSENSGALLCLHRKERLPGTSRLHQESIKGKKEVRGHTEET